MKEIKLTKGQVATVDDEDFERLSQFKWFAGKSGKRFYAARNFALGGGIRKTLFMHRIILDTPSNVQVDHISGNPLDNRRANLRLATRQQNVQNQKHPHKNNKLGVKGVYWNKEREKYRANIRYNGKLIHLGYFGLLVDADSAYRTAEIKYFGEFARTSVVI